MAKRMRAAGGDCTSGEVANCYKAKFVFKSNFEDPDDTKRQFEQATADINAILARLTPPQDGSDRNELVIIAEPDERNEFDELHLAWVRWQPETEA